MTDDLEEPIKPKKTPRAYPKLKVTNGNSLDADLPSDWDPRKLMGMQTHDAAIGVYSTAIMALGEWAEKHADLVSAMFAETEPQDGIEAMLIAQMTATHVAMTALCARMSSQMSSDTRESYERSMTRLSRTYLAQMDALKKHRAKMQQTVRVDRVTLHEGAQAIVGTVNHDSGTQHEK